MDELPVGVRAAMAMANGNRPTMTAEVVAVEEVQALYVLLVVLGLLLARQAVLLSEQNLLMTLRGLWIISE